MVIHEDNKVVAIVDDDAPVRVALEGLLKSAGLTARAFESAETFIKSGHLHLLSGFYECFRGLKCPCSQSSRFQQPLQCDAHCLVIIDNRDYSVISINDHSSELSAAGVKGAIIRWYGFAKP